MKISSVVLKEYKIGLVFDDYSDLDIFLDELDELLRLSKTELGRVSDRLSKVYNDGMELLND